MGTRVKLASSHEEISALMRVRHVVALERASQPPQPGAVLVDVLDAVPGTANLVALVDGDVRGGIRLLPDSSGPFESALGGLLRRGSSPACCDHLCSMDGDPRIVSGLLRMSVYWAHMRGHTHLCGAFPAGIRAIAEQVGFVSIGSPEGAMVLDLAAPGAALQDFLRRQDIGAWVDTFERAFFEPGDVIVQVGNVGHEAYLVVDGLAEARMPDSNEAAAWFRPGDMFGELALLTERPRVATVVATRPTDVMVLTRDRFRQQVASDPDLALQLMESIGGRFHDVLTRQPARG